MRRLVIGLMVLALLGGAACSDDDDGGGDAATDTEGGVGGSGDVDAYCAAVREYAELVDSGEGDADQLVEAYGEALRQAPAEISGATAQALSGGDEAAAAQEQIDEFNRENCDVDTASLPAPSG